MKAGKRGLKLAGKGDQLNGMFILPKLAFKINMHTVTPTDRHAEVEENPIPSLNAHFLLSMLNR